jgi:NAD(P)-dependent dehydrogenase (short-subunit alcohol dehydrogenase family)
MGYGHAALLAARGATVVVNDYKQELADEAVKSIIDNGGKAEAVVSDISVPANCRSLVEQTVEKYGRIDILVNNAGIAQFKEFQAITEDDFFRMMGVHLFGSWFLTQAAWPHMIKQKYGRVAMISSGSLFGMANQAHYTTAKTACFGLGLNLAVEGRPHGINVNILDVIAGTEMTKEGMTDGPLKSFILDNFPLEGPANVMAWLCHETCTETGRFVPSGGKGFGLHYFASHPGWWTKSADWMTPELVRDNFSKVLDYENHRVVSSAQVCSELVAGRAGYKSMGDLAQAAQAPKQDS